MAGFPSKPFKEMHVGFLKVTAIYGHLSGHAGHFFFVVQHYFQRNFLLSFLKYPFFEQ